MRQSLAALTLAAVALAPAAPAFAHARVVSSNPAPNAAVAAPKRISVTFNEKLVPAFSKVEVSMVGMNMKVPVKTSVSTDGKTIVAVPQGAFMKGSYVIKWSAAAADDGHHTAGTIPFKVR